MFDKSIFLWGWTQATAPDTKRTTHGPYLPTNSNGGHQGGGGWGKQLCCSINMFFLLGAGYLAIPIMYSQRLSGFWEFLSAVLEFQIFFVVALEWGLGNTKV